MRLSFIYLITFMIKSFTVRAMIRIFYLFNIRNSINHEILLNFNDLEVYMEGSIVNIPAV